MIAFIRLLLFPFPMNTLKLFLYLIISNSLNTLFARLTINKNYLNLLTLASIQLSLIFYNILDFMSLMSLCLNPPFFGTK